jgi:limonene-1,2-epoxide hydrolase
VFALGDAGHVLHERVDRYKLRGKWFELPCNAHWVVKAGKVISWRDYFDFGTYVRQMESIGIKPPQ